jgi:methionyl-tRNA synthetase
MANAKKCDRCGKFYQEMVNPTLTVRQYVSMRDRHVDYDLCPKCTEKLYSFMKMERNPSKKINDTLDSIDLDKTTVPLARAEINWGRLHITEEERDND